MELGEEKIDYLEMVRNLKEDPTRTRNSKILIIDGLNLLLRAFSSIKLVNPQGNNVGGITGFLKSLAVLKRQFNPTRIIIAWDGKGGATNRKHLNANYKAQRAHSSVIHWDIYDSKEEEMQSVHDQADRLEDYLECLPVTFVKIDKLEADDIIAYLAQTAARGENHKVIIASMDKDFLQLVSDNIEVYSPTKKVLYTRQGVLDYLGVLPENYNIVKALIGDPSDNIEGIKGLGVKTLVKIFPGLAENPEFSLQDVYNICAKNLGVKKVCATILANWDKVETNFKIMDLHTTVLDENEKKILFEEIRKPVEKVQTGRFLTYLDQDVITGITSDTESWLSQFSNLYYFS